MKCPKCSYISYDMPERCRNCGYDFPLASTTSSIDLPLRGDHDAGPAPDFPLGPTAERELPLFGDADQAPLVTPSGAPRSPLAVRRSPSDQSRQRPVGRRDRRAAITRTPAPPVIVTPTPAAVARHEAPPLLPHLVPPAPAGPPGADDVGVTTLDGPVPDQRPADAAPGTMVVGDAAPPLRRLAAAAIDFALIGAIDLAVIRLTLAVLDAPWSRALSLRWVPLGLFFVLLNGGYLVAFTVASGQTIGKMLTGVRVVGESSLRVPVAQAAVRVAVLVLAIAPLGLGYLPALVTRSARGIHDRLSNTRVIRA